MRNFGIRISVMVGLVVAASAAACSSNDTTTSTGTPISRGEALVKAQDCASCHQDTGGKTLAGRLQPVANTAKSAIVYGPNLTPDVDTGLGSWTDAQIITALKDGKDDEGEALCPTMPSFSRLGDASLSDIVAYLRSLPAVSNQAPESICPPLKPGDGAADGGAD